jgi:phosphatidylserine/phosphatidylglycerophosphate/cardiolipin synthase-like enzyme
MDIDRVELCFSQVLDTPLRGRSLKRAIRKMISNAKRSIVLCSCEFTPGPDFILNEELTEQMRLGREVSVYGDKADQMQSLKAIFMDLGLRAFLWKPTRDKSLFHIKAIIVDDVWIYIGSANMSWNAMSNSVEWGIVAHSPDICGELNGYLEELIDMGRFEEV